MADNTKTPLAIEYPNGSAAALYELRTQYREPYLRRAEEAAKFTIPSLQPEMGTNGTSTLRSPFQSVGARGLKNLAAKMLLTILPANAPFFRESIDEFVLEDLSQGDPDLKTEIESSLNKIERTIQTHIEETTTRVTLSEALLHYFNSGNALLYVPDDGNTRMFTLSNYVVVRSPNGQVMNIITKEEVERAQLSAHQLDILTAAEKAAASVNVNTGYATQPNKTVCIHTQCKLYEEKWQVTQEINGYPDPKASGTYPKDSCAYLPLRFRKLDGEDYGRGFIEENIGDLRSLEGLSQAMVEASIAASKMLILVNANGQTSKKTISNSPNLAVRDGRAEDVTFLHTDKTADLNWSRQQAELIERRLEITFLLNSAVQRDAERVTAEEIRFVAQELEDGLGAVYSILSQELQLPLVNRFHNILQRAGKIPVLPKSQVKPQIITGLEALGRGHDSTRLDEYMAFVKETVPPEQIATYVDLPSILKKKAIAIGVDVNLARSNQDVQATMQQNQQAALMDKAVPNVVKGVSDNINQAQAQASVQPQSTTVQ